MLATGEQDWWYYSPSMVCTFLPLNTEMKVTSGMALQESC